MATINIEIVCKAIRSAWYLAHEVPSESEWLRVYERLAAMWVLALYADYASESEDVRSQIDFLQKIALMHAKECFRG